MHPLISGRLVAPEQTVTLGTEDDAARRDGREFLRGYLQMTNYVTTTRRGLRAVADRLQLRGR